MVIKSLKTKTKPRYWFLFLPSDKRLTSFGPVLSEHSNWKPNLHPTWHLKIHQKKRLVKPEANNAYDPNAFGVNVRKKKQSAGTSTSPWKYSSTNPYTQVVSQDWEDTSISSIHIKREQPIQIKQISTSIIHLPSSQTYGTRQPTTSTRPHRKEQVHLMPQKGLPKQMPLHHSTPGLPERLDQNYGEGTQTFTWILSSLLTPSLTRDLWPRLRPVE